MNETIGTKMKEAKHDVKTAAELAGDQVSDYLSDTWTQVKDGAYETKETLTEGYEKGLETARSKVREWQNEAGEDRDRIVARLKTAIADAERELRRLKESGRTEWETTRASFNIAWAELKSGMIRALAAFEK